MKKVRKIQMLIRVILSVLVVLIVASVLVFWFSGKNDSKQVSSSVSVKDSSSQVKSDKDTKVKEEEIQKLKDQLASLDSKIAESEALVGKLKKETAVPKLDFEALRNNDLSSLEGTWLTPSGNQYIINSSGEVRSTWLSNGEKQESIVQLSGARKLNENPETVIIGAGVKDSLVGGFAVLAVPSGVVLQPSDDGKFTDKSNHSEERLLGGQGYNAMLMHPENVYYRVKPDTSQLEAEEQKLANLKAERETIKTKLETKEKKNTSE